MKIHLSIEGSIGSELHILGVWVYESQVYVLSKYVMPEQGKITFASVKDICASVTLPNVPDNLPIVHFTLGTQLFLNRKRLDFSKGSAQVIYTLAEMPDAVLKHHQHVYCNPDFNKLYGYFISTPEISKSSSSLFSKNVALAAAFSFGAVTTALITKFVS